MQRRTFLQGVGALTVASVVGCRKGLAASAAPTSTTSRSRLSRIGLELYSVRKAMRADFGQFPAYSGGVSHFPMSTRIIEGGSRLS